MPRRRRAAAYEPGPGDRVRSLLGAPAPGWVPPEEDSTGGWLEPWADQASPVPSAEPEPVGDLVGGDGAGVDVDPSWQGRGPARPRSHAARGAVRDLLPPAVLAGRLDPGRRGAAALVLVALTGAVVAGVVVTRGRPQEVVVPAVVATGVPLPGASPTAEPPAADVVVAVGGKVARPGLVRLPVGSRVDDAVRAAGGPLPGTGVGLLNLARRLVDGELVLVGVAAPAGAPTGATGGGSAAPGPVDLNTATVGDFDGLPGIGPVLAERIVDHRTRNGPFRSVDQLREVSGIGEAKYSTLKDLVRV